MFSGRLTLLAVSARDEAGREIFRAAEVEATAPVGELLGAAPLTLQRVRVVAPRLVVAQAPALTLIGLGAAGLAGPPGGIDGSGGRHGALRPAEPRGPAPGARGPPPAPRPPGALRRGRGAVARETAHR